MPEMKTLLLNTTTGLYFQGINKWTADPEQAFDFKLVQRALKFVEIWGLRDVELAFSFSDLLYPTGVSLQPRIRPQAN